MIEQFHGNIHSYFEFWKHEFTQISDNLSIDFNINVELVTLFLSLNKQLCNSSTIQYVQISLSDFMYMIHFWGLCVWLSLFVVTQQFQLIGTCNRHSLACIDSSVHPFLDCQMDIHFAEAPGTSNACKVMGCQCREIMRPNNTGGKLNDL